MYERYFTDKTVLDIGCGDDKITESATGWELEPDGNGQMLATIPDTSFDVVFSSHFLEHVADPLEGLLNQWRVLRPGGYLIFQIPDEDLYEQCLYPSPWNSDHKYTWTIHKDHTWSPASKNVVDLIRYLPNHKIISMKIVDTGYRYDIVNPRTAVDQTEKYGAEAAVEVIVQKYLNTQVCQGGLVRVFQCPKCNRLEFVIRGLNSKDQLDGWCRGCGVVGEFTL